MDTIKIKQFADAMENGEFICIRTFSGYLSSALDPKGKTYCLSPKAPDEALGAAVLDSLNHSRFLPVKEHKDFYCWKSILASNEEWVRNMLKRYNYKTRREMFADMKSCGIERVENKLVLKPRYHAKSEVWERKKSDGFEDVIIPAGNQTKEIGEALRLAFSRCT